MAGREGSWGRVRGVSVVVIGNVGVDTNVYLRDADIDWSVEANFTENIDNVGQAGGYAARGFRALGHPTAFIGHVGDDPNGRWIRDTFAREDIDARALWTDPAGTARSINLMYRDGRRKNFYDGRGHMTLAPDLDSARSALSGARLVHVNLANWARLLLPLAREQGAVISCDLQDVRSLDDPYRRDFIAQADVLFFSSANLGDQIEPFVAGLLRRNPTQTVVVGMGARGCALGSAGEVRRFEPLEAFGPVVDTNGAGDGLAVGFLSARVLEGLPLEDAVRRGQTVARFACAQRAPKRPLTAAEL